MSPSSVTLVTGATGFVGSHLVEQLVARGHRVRCLVRPTSQLTYLQNLPIDIRTGHLDGTLDWSSVLADVDCVFHVAGLTMAARRDEFFAVNQRATARLVQALVRHSRQARRLVYVSSLAAVGPSPPGQVVDEETAPRPITAYGQSKLAGEQEVLRAGDSVAVTIVRPPAIYGPRDRAFLALFKMARLGIFPVIGLRPRRVSLVHVADVVEALVLAATQANGAGRTYFVSGRSPYSSQDIRAALASACGRRLRRVPLLGWQLYSAGLWEEATARVRRRLPNLTRDRARELLQPSWVCSAERAERELGFTPRVPLDEGLRQTLAWYRQAGWLA